MTVAYDFFTASAAGNTTRNWTHTPVGTPVAVIVFIGHDGTGDDISGVTYGGVAMTELTGSPNLLTGGEVNQVYAYFLGSNIPTGDQTVTATSIGSAGNKIGFAITLTGAADTEVVDVDATINSTSLENPSITLSLAGRSCFCALVFASGHDAVTSVAPLTGWTSHNETDAGTEVTGCYSYDTVGTTDVTAGWAQTAEDANAICVAVSEVASDPVGNMLGGKLIRGGLLLHGVLGR